MPPEPICRCGHDREHHDHLRRGTDCAVCGARACSAFRASRRSPSGVLLAAMARLAPRGTGAGTTRVVVDHPTIRTRPGPASPGGDGPDPAVREA